MSQNILFNYPPPAANQSLSDKPSMNKIHKEMTRKKSTFLYSAEGNEESSLINGIQKAGNSNYSFDKPKYKKHDRYLQNFGIFANNANIFSESSWVHNKGGCIAKHFADSARFRIEKLYSKFGL